MSFGMIMKNQIIVRMQNTDNLIVYVKTDDIQKGNAEDVEIRFDTNFELDRPLPEGKNKNVIGLMKDELGS